jgi:hypothetical protein
VLKMKAFVRNHGLVISLLVLTFILATLPATGNAQVVATPPYSVSTFATAPQGLSAPDSVTFSATNIFHRIWQWRRPRRIWRGKQRH